MADTPITHEELDKWLTEQPKYVLGRLPNNIERREAERLVDVIADLAHQSREKKADH